MLYKSLILSAFVASAAAANLRTPVRFEDASRKLSYEFIAGYRPDSSVTDHNAIDLDQAVIESLVGSTTQDGFDAAKMVYEQGGHSKSYAKLNMSTMPPSASINDGDKWVGKNSAGATIVGKIYKSADTIGNNMIYLQYQTSDVQSDYMNCKVGGLPVDKIVTDGCFANSGSIKKDGQTTEYSYSYSSDTDNENGRTIKGFSTSVEKKMISCANCPYKDAAMFKAYYGDSAYADKWVQAAISGTKTSFTSGKGNADFSEFDETGRAQCIKKGTAYMNVFMYVIREFEDALDDCKDSCIYCNDDPVHAWDEGVAFYSGTMEGEQGEGSGKLLHALADKRCGDYNTCVEDTSNSKVNMELFQLFNVGQGQLQTGKCADARVTKDKIVDLMYIPLIQGTMRYAHKVDKLGLTGDKEKAEGAVFAAAVLPRIADANADAANTIYENMKVGATSTDFKAVRKAFESTYGKLNIQCNDVGGLVDGAGKYYEGAAPCEDSSTKSSSTGATVGIVIGSVGGAVAVASLGYIFFLRGREKQGKPVFAPNSDERAI